MSWYQDWVVKHAYFPSQDRIPGKWELLRRIARDKLSFQAQLKLEWIIFYHTVGRMNASVTSSHFGISRKTFNKWLSRFNERNLVSLEERSRVPQTKRSWTVTHQEEERVVALRRQHLKWGKEKLAREYTRVYGESLSTHKIQRVINRYRLYPDPVVRQKRLRQKRKRREKTYIHTFTKEKELGFLWHVDAIVIWWYGVRRVIFTALEEVTKIGYARVYPTNSSRNAKDFLKRLLYLAHNQVVNIHQDNGSEFMAEFEVACKELGIRQIYSRVRTPTDNAALERFNWTVQDEWLSLSETGLDEIPKANDDLTRWLVEYNNIRPHQSLDYLTPLAYATENFQVSPMWSASTLA